MLIKRNGISIYLEEDYDSPSEYVGEMLRDYAGDFSEAGFTTPERFANYKEAESGGYKLIEGYYGGNWDFVHFKKGEEITNTYSRQYDLLVYGRKNDKRMKKIVERLNDTWETAYYKVKVEGLNGERLDGLSGITFWKDNKDVRVDELDTDTIIKELENMGVEIPEVFYGKNSLAESQQATN